jgi:hypothetical protein
MKTKTRTTKGIAIAVTALALASASFAQQAAKPPVPGTYYSAKDFEWKPPLPFNPHPDLPAVEFEPGRFLVDDTGVPDTPEQAEARKRWQEADALAKAIAADPVLAAAARKEKEEAARKREADWQARLEAAQPFLPRGDCRVKPRRSKPVRKPERSYRSWRARPRRLAPTCHALRRSWTPSPSG